MLPPIFETSEIKDRREAFKRFIELEFNPLPFWKRIFCIHYWIEINRKFYGLIEGTKIVWGCGKCGKKIERSLLDIPKNPLRFKE